MPKLTVADLQAARLQKLLDKVYRFDEGVMTLGTYLRRYPPDSKGVKVRLYERHRKCLEYRELKVPQVEYYLYWENTWMRVGKLIYDSLDVPEHKNE